MSHYALVDQLGYIPMQHSDYAVGAGAPSLDQRLVPYGVRMKKRHVADGDGGHYEDDEDARGDIISGCYWPTADEGLRPTGAWRWGAWPATLTGVSGDTATAKPARPKLGGVEADPRFDPMSVATMGKPPLGAWGLVVDGTDEAKQTPMFFSSTNVDIAQWRGLTPPAFSTFIYDVTAEGALDYSRRARLDTWTRVTSWAPPIGFGGPAPPDTDSAGLAWLLGRTVTGTRGLGWGLVTDPAHTCLGYASAERGGPWFIPQQGGDDVGGTGDQHIVGLTPDGESNFPVHLHVNSLWTTGRRASAGDFFGDGPMFFEGPYAGAGGFPRSALVHLEWDKTVPHIIPNIDGTGSVLCKGKWRWRAEVPQNPPAPPSGGAGPGCGSGGGIAHALPAITPLEMGQPALAWRPQLTWQDDPGFVGDMDITRYNTRALTPAEDAAWEGTPITARMESVGARLSGEWVRDFAAQPRYRCGTGPGSILVLPGNYGAEDARIGSTTTPIEAASSSGMAFVQATLGVGCVQWNPETGSGAAGLFTYRDGTTSTSVVRTQMRNDAGATDSSQTWAIEAVVRFDNTPGFTQSAALGGGAVATLGTIGGQGPSVQAQNSWLKCTVNGATRYIPVWA